MKGLRRFFIFLSLLIIAVMFEKGEYENCIELCKQAVDVGREQRADYPLIAKFVFLIPPICSLNFVHITVNFNCILLYLEF